MGRRDWEVSDRVGWRKSFLWPRKRRAAECRCKSCQSIACRRFRSQLAGQRRRIPHPREETEEAGRIIRQAPVLVDACREASRRLAKAKHPNAKALRALIHGALQGLEVALDNHVTDRIDP